MNPIPLEGCTPEPLMNYLKALGVFRIVSEQCDHSIRATWNNGRMILHTKLSRDSLIDFFLYDYVPTPVIVPWTGSDFFEVALNRPPARYRTTPSGSKIIEAFCKSESPRFSEYRETLNASVALLKSLGILKKEQMKGATKASYISNLRAVLPPRAVQWIDAAASLPGDSLMLNTLLGSGGGSDGNTHFSDNFMQNLWESLPDFSTQKTHKNDSDLTANIITSTEQLMNSLFNEQTNKLIPKRTSSLYDSGAVGGPNAGHGLKREAIANPWSFILTIEGSIAFAGSVSRKQGASLSNAVFPFQTRMSAAGSATLCDKEVSGQEIWLPLWKRPCKYPEISTLVSEGRAEWNGNMPRQGVDFAKAVASLGVDRGIDSFVRYGIIRGRVGGDNYNTAVSLGYFNVAEKSNAFLLREIDPWLAAMKRCCNDKTPARFRNALREIEQSIFDYCQHGDADGDTSRFQRILIGLGKAERIIASAPMFRADANGLRPIALLSSAWITAAADPTHEWEIALALASLHHPEIGPLRLNLEDIAIHGTSITWADRNHAAVWSSADLPANIAAVLYRRVMMADKAGNASHALTSSHRASLASISAFLTGDLDFSRISDLLWALSLCKTHEYRTPSLQRSTEEYPILPAAYCLLKLLFHPHKELADQTNPPRPDLGILGLLRADRTTEACQRAVRILRGRNLTAKPFAMRGFPSRDSEWRDLASADCDSTTLAAALLIPITHSSMNYLKKRIIRDTQSKPSTTI